MIPASPANGGARFADTCVGVRDSGEGPAALVDSRFYIAEAGEAGVGRNIHRARHQLRIKRSSWCALGKGNCREPTGKRRSEKIKSAGEKGECKGKKTNSHDVLKVKKE